jgi:hypothetical protein
MEVPTFSAYAEEFMKSYALANSKPSEQAAKEVELIDTVPRIKLLKLPPQKFDFLTLSRSSRASSMR